MLCWLSNTLIEWSKVTEAIVTSVTFALSDALASPWRGGAADRAATRGSPAAPSLTADDHGLAFAPCQTDAGSF